MRGCSLKEYGMSGSNDTSRLVIRRLEQSDSHRRRTATTIGPMLIVSLVVAVCLAVTGCQSSKESESPKSQASDISSGDPPEREGYGHDRPPHKPENFREAVTEIRRRWQELETETTEPADSRRQELDEILVWLPELAAETDLRKAEWDQVNAISKQLLAEFRSTAPPASLRSSPERWTGAWEELAAVAATLSED